jgi:polyisoprenoid-binding protein YceI
MKNPFPFLHRSALSFHWLALLALIVTLSACQLSAPQQPDKWQVVSESSRIYLVTTKKGHIAEVMNLPALSGQVSNGQLTVQIDLSKIDSGIAVRDERMQKDLFETDKFKIATLTAAVPDSIWHNGKHKIVMTLSLHGKTRDLPAEIWVSELDNGQRLISLIKPVVVKAEDFDLAEGVDLLAKLASLLHISHSVPVTAELVLAPVD